MENKEKEIINESIKVADVLAKELAFWKKMFKWSCIISISFIFILLTACYIYIYNTDTVIETTTLDGVQALYTKEGHNLITSDYITNENIIKLMETMKQTNNITNK